MCQVLAPFVAGCACLYSRNAGEDGLRYIAGDGRSHGYAHDKGCSGRGQVCARGPVDGRYEGEWCEVFAAHVEPGELHINQEEISEVRRVASSELDDYLQGHPEQLVPWLREALSDPSIRTALAM